MRMENIIINVGRRLGSGGRDIAARLAGDFGCALYDRELLNLAARESGFCKEVFERNDENRGFLRSLFHMHVPHVSDINFYSNELSQENLFKFQSDAIRRAATEGSADPDSRIRRVCERHGCSIDEARELIARGDRDRAAYYNYYTGKTWGHSESYDLCIDSGIMGLERTGDFIRDFIKERFAK